MTYDVCSDRFSSQDGICDKENGAPRILIFPTYQATYQATFRNNGGYQALTKSIPSDKYRGFLYVCISLF